MEESLKTQRERIYRHYCSDFAQNIYYTTLYRYVDNGVIIQEDAKFFDINDVIYVIDNCIDKNVVINWYNYKCIIEELNNRIGSDRLKVPSIKDYYEGKYIIPESDIKEIEHSLNTLDRLIERVNK